MLVHSSEWEPMIKNLELKPLCARILEKTINDPDKYQPGLTKIFFRAGMLAALESLRSNRLNALVTIVQKNMRRKMAVKKYTELRQATIKIQTWWRGILAQRLVAKVRRDVAAIRLQRGVRRYLQRKHFLDVRNSVVAVQARTYAIAVKRLHGLNAAQVLVVHLLAASSPILSGHTQSLPSKASSVDCE